MPRCYTLAALSSLRAAGAGPRLQWVNLPTMHFGKDAFGVVTGDPSRRASVNPRVYVAGDVAVGTVIYPPGGTFGPRVQADYQLVMLHTGDLHVRVDQSRQHVPMGHVALLRPGPTEFFSFATEGESWHSWIALHRPQLTAGQWDLLRRAPSCLPLSREMEAYTELALAAHGLATSDQLLHALGHAALLLYLGEAENRASLHDREHPAVTAARHHIHRHLADDITLDHLAQAAAVTPGHLTRLFRSHLGTTPMAYLWAERTRWGVQLLRQTGLSVSEISASVGFATPFHFSRRVKQETGYAPLELRRSAWAANGVLAPDTIDVMMSPAPV